MHPVRHAPSLEPPCIRIRRAALTEIDVLAAIDQDAAALFERAGLYLDLPPDHEYALAERDRWLRSVSAGTTLLATDDSGAPVGFAAAAVLDSEGYIEQLSVRTGSMRRGIGAALLRATARAAAAAGHGALWLTTYNHLPWNRPFYERHGFVTVAPERHGPGIAKTLAYERQWLPQPRERIAMRCSLR